MARNKKRRSRRLIWNGSFKRGGGWLGVIVALATFVTAWGYCAIHYGFLFGFGLGWVPAGMLAVIAGAVSWLVSPLAAGLLLGSLLLVALWQDPALLVWFSLALFGAWVICRRRRLEIDVDRLDRLIGGRRRKLKSRGKRDGILAVLTAFSADAEKTRKSSQPRRPPEELLH